MFDTLQCAANMIYIEGFLYFTLSSFLSVGLTKGPSSLLSWCFVSLKKPNVEPGMRKKVSKEFQEKSLADIHNARR